MHSHRFDALTRSLGARLSRRGLVRAGTGGLTTLLGWPFAAPDIEARGKHHKKGKKKKKSKKPSPPATICTPKCGRKQCGNDGCDGSCGGCAAGQVCASGTCCTPEPPEETCAVRWGTVPDRFCHQPVACTCPSGRVRLDNGGCATACQTSCPGNCSCSLTTEGTTYCVGFVTCTAPLCTSSADCLPGRICRPSTCDPGVNRCVELCNG
jgi:hypothetical protein